MENSDWTAPPSLEDITEEWVCSLIYHICRLPSHNKKLLSISSINIESNLNSGEGALSDICHVSAKAKVLSDSEREFNVCSEKVFEVSDVCSVKSLILDQTDDVDEQICLNGIEPHDREEKVIITENGVTSESIVYNLFIKLVPDGLKDLIDTHGLFEREIAVYR